MVMQNKYSIQFDLNREYRDKIFWTRFGEKPRFYNKKILDFGCGVGSLSIDIAQNQAKKVIGIDVDESAIQFAKQNLTASYPHLSSVIVFQAGELIHYVEDEFDYIVSKDVFEHVLDLPEYLIAMKKRLKPGGRIYAGFGPLYPSPYGDHDRRRTGLSPYGVVGRILARIPWLHLLMEDKIVQMHRQHLGKEACSMYDLGLNKRSVSDYRQVFKDSGLVILDFRVNCSSNIGSRLLSAIGKVPCLENYCSHNLYCILMRQ